MNKQEIIESLISDYINHHIDLNDWNKVCVSYNSCSFIVFLTLISLDMGFVPAKGESLFAFSYRSNFIDKDTFAFLNNKNNFTDFEKRCVEVLSDLNVTEIEELYQNYKARDFFIRNGKFIFETGKSQKSSLGAFYTQSEFAAKIVKWSLDSWFESNKKIPTVLDSSCGAGEFLLEVLKYYADNHIKITDQVVSKLYGYDVDPLAVLLTRYRLAKFTGSRICKSNIKLGNPLCLPSDGHGKFNDAVENRFYSQNSGIAINDRFDVIVGNPPWEKIRFEEKKFLRHFVDDKEIAEKNKRSLVIQNSGPANKKYVEQIENDYNLFKKSISKHPLLDQSVCGELNTYALFTEMTRNILSDNGNAVLIVKASLLKMPVYSKLFNDLIVNGNLYKVDFFTNKKKIFPIDSREEFAVIYLKKSDYINSIKTRFHLTDLSQLDDDSQIIEVTPGLLKKINPLTGMYPNVKDKSEIDFLKKIYNEKPSFEEVFPDCRYGRLVHFTNHSEHIIRRKKSGYLPVYEGKFIGIYTGKFSTFAGVSESLKYKNKASAENIKNPHGKEYPESRYFIEKDFWKKLSCHMNEPYSVMWRSLTSSSNERTMIATVLPTIPASQSVQLLQTDSIEEELIILSLFNSIVFDYILRMKMVGLDLTQTIIRQMPVPQSEKYEEVIIFKGKEASLKKHIFSRIKLLYQDDFRLRHLFDGIETYEIEYDFDSKQIISELDLLIAEAYGLNKSEIRKIASDFVGFYSEDEIQKWF